MKIYCVGKQTAIETTIIKWNEHLWVPTKIIDDKKAHKEIVSLVPTPTTDGDTTWRMETGRMEPERCTKGDDQDKNPYWYLYPKDTQGNVEEEFGIPLQAVQLVCWY